MESIPTTAVVVQFTADFNQFYQSQCRCFDRQTLVPFGVYRVGVKVVNLKGLPLNDAEMLFITIQKGQNISFITENPLKPPCSILKAILPNGTTVKEDFTQFMEYSTVSLPFTAGPLNISLYNERHMPMGLSGTILFQCIGDRNVISPQRKEN